MSRTYTDEHIDTIINKSVEAAISKAEQRFEIKVGAMFEDFEHRHQLTYEAIDFIKEQVKDIPQMKQVISDLKADMKTVKQAIRETNKDIGWVKSVAHTH